MDMTFKQRLNKGLKEERGGLLIGGTKPRKTNEWINFLRMYKVRPSKEAGILYRTFQSTGEEPTEEEIMYLKSLPGPKRCKSKHKPEIKDAIDIMEDIKTMTNDDYEIEDIQKAIEDLIDIGENGDSELQEVIEEAIEEANGSGLLGGRRRRKEASRKLNPYIQYLKTYHTREGYKPKTKRSVLDKRNKKNKERRNIKAREKLRYYRKRKQ